MSLFPLPLSNASVRPPGRVHFFCLPKRNEPKTNPWGVDLDARSAPAGVMPGMAWLQRAPRFRAALRGFLRNAVLHFSKPRSRRPWRTRSAGQRSIGPFPLSATPSSAGRAGVGRTRSPRECRPAFPGDPGFAISGKPARRGNGPLDRCLSPSRPCLGPPSIFIPEDCPCPPCASSALHRGLRNGVAVYATASRHCACSLRGAGR